LGRKHLPLDTFGHFISGRAYQYVQTLVMKAMRTAPVAKLVVVIDDDPLVLEATGGLLRSWGCCVVAGKSCDEAVVRLAETEAGRRPDLIVCDYQLSRGLTGVEAIERLRSTFGKIPALLISADASSPSCEVGSRSYQLLYKPVNAERFHAALVAASVLRRPSGTRTNGRDLPQGKAERVMTN
jgi:CheY-like chemotaxis protein